MNTEIAPLSGSEMRGIMKPHTVWSLLEMLQAYAKPFVEAADLLAQLLIATDDVNIQAFDAENFCDFVELRMKGLMCELDNLQLWMTKLSAERLLELARNREKNRLSWRNNVIELHSRLRDELGSIYLLSLNPIEAEQYEASMPFGEGVNNQFPGIIDELHEASKCLALGRSTAAAFHYIRSLEAGIKAVYRCLGIPDPIKGPEKNWSKIHIRINAVMDSQWPRNQRLSGDARFFDSVVKKLAAMQNPYRNETMHFEAKYTPEEAHEIAVIVGGIMKEIASRMDEDGQPLAELRSSI